MLRTKDVMKMFKISKPTIYKWISNGMPHIYVGKLLFFEQDAITVWVKSHGG
jgi:predicted DNA-binding transcriptional regulator AlpA